MRAVNGQFLKGTHWRKPAPHWEADWLREQYIALGRSAGDIASEADTTDAAIIYWLKKHGIPRRSTSQARAIKHWGASGAANPMHGKTGSANPRFIDGSSPERQRLYAQGAGRDFIKLILARDEYRCRRCGAPKGKPRSLHVHHIRPWAGNETLRFEPTNAVTLCRNCHSWVHSRANTESEFLS